MVLVVVRFGGCDCERAEGKSWKVRVWASNEGRYSLVSVLKYEI